MATTGAQRRGFWRWVFLAQRRATDERGATLVILSVGMVMLLGFSAFAVDIGHGFEVRRQLTTSTDAAALSAAQAYAWGGDGCDNANAQDLVVANDSSATSIVCTPGGGAAVGSTRDGYVTVEAESPIEYMLAPAIGIADGLATSSTTARYGVPSTVDGGLRPLGLCIMSLVSNSTFVTWSPSDGESAPIRVTYDGSGPLQCSGSAVPGNWGVLDLDGGGNSNNDTKDWVENGYPGEVAIPSVIPGDPGAFSNSLASSLDHLVTTGEVFPIPIYDNASDNGNNASFNVVGIARVRLVDFGANGDPNGRFIEFTLVPGSINGDCCSSDAIAIGARTWMICSVDPDELSDCS